MVKNSSAPAVVSLGLTKCGKRQGVLKMVWVWKSCNSAHAKLCPGSSAWRNRGVLSLQSVSLDLDSFKFRPYSLRRGGATWWISHGLLDKLLIAGRWQAAKTDCISMKVWQFLQIEAFF